VNQGRRPARPAVVFLRGLADAGGAEVRAQQKRAVPARRAPATLGLVAVALVVPPAARS